MRQNAHRDLGIDMTNDYNIALCGISGVGKSSLINAFRNLKDDHELAAPVFTGIEGPNVISKYYHTAQNMNRIVFWDIPGAGTLKYPTTKEYFLQNHLYAFDYLLLVCSDRFMDVDFEIAKLTGSILPTAFVRNKFDAFVDAKRRINSNRSTDDIKSTLKKQIVQEFRNNLIQAKMSNYQGKLYIVSSVVYQDRELANLYGMDEQSMLTTVVNEIERNRV